MDELEDMADLKILVCDYLQGLSLTAGQVTFIFTIFNKNCGYIYLPLVSVVLLHMY